MKYLGIARKEKGKIVMPDGFREIEEGRTYEAVEIGGDILLAASPLDRERFSKIAQLAGGSIEERRKSLEGLAGGVHGITNPGGLESALARPFTVARAEKATEEIAAWLKAHSERWQEP